MILTFQRTSEQIRFTFAERRNYVSFQKKEKNNLKLPSNRQSSANRHKNRSTMSNGILYFV